MSLPDVLSALRELVLGAIQIPDDSAARKQLYSNLFPGLSSAELNDLSRIPRQQLERYSTGARRVRQEILETRFPMTLSFLSEHWLNEFSSVYCVESLLEALQDFQPWQSASSTDLANTFGEFILHSRFGFTHRWPELGDLSRIELLSVRLRHPGLGRDMSWKSNPITTGESSNPDEPLTAAYYWIPGEVIFKEFRFDVVGALLHFYEFGKLPTAIESNPIFAVGSRNHRGLPRWLSVSQALFRYLEQVPPDRVSPVSELRQELNRAEENSEMPPGEAALLPSCLRQLSSYGAICFKG